jgi:NAD+ synthase
MKLEDKISKWLKEYIQQNKLQTFVVGVSGGIDSAVTSTLCARTGIPTITINMPLKSQDINTGLSNLHLEWLSKNYENVKTDVICLDSIFRAFSEAMQEYEHDLGFANSKSRLRMVSLYQIAAKTSGIVVGTGNKVEDFGVGFFTKYGDGGVDISPIADLTKTQVRKLAKELGVETAIIEAPPTDGLWEDSRSDEEQIGASYEELEWAMSYLEENTPLNLTSRQKEVVAIYKKFNEANFHKMRNIPVFQVEE